MKEVKSIIIKARVYGLILFVLGIVFGLEYEKIAEIAGYSYPLQDSKLQVCFTPPKGCGAVIASKIREAKDTIYIQAYGMTHPEITNALIDAKERGVIVKVLLDRSNLKQGYSKMKELQAAGIEVDIDNISGIAHNKVIVIDKHITVTGSFNFTANADNRNTENVLIIEDHNLAKSCLQNWFNRKAKVINKPGNDKQQIGLKLSSHYYGNRINRELK